MTDVMITFGIIGVYTKSQLLQQLKINQIHLIRNWFYNDWDRENVRNTKVLLAVSTKLNAQGHLVALCHCNSFQRNIPYKRTIHTWSRETPILQKNYIILNTQRMARPMPYVQFGVWETQSLLNNTHLSLTKLSVPSHKHITYIAIHLKIN
jgi:hypothetical protein